MSHIDVTRQDGTAGQAGAMETFASAVARGRARAANLRERGYFTCAQEIEMAINQWSAVIAGLN